jgi:hypothetical protein
VKEGGGNPKYYKLKRPGDDDDWGNPGWKEWKFWYGGKWIWGGGNYPLMDFFQGETPQLRLVGCW